MILAILLFLGAVVFVEIANFVIRRALPLIDDHLDRGIGEPRNEGEANKED